MSINPKLDFFSIKLHPKDKEDSTFLKFAIDEAGGKKSLIHSECTKVLFKFFLKSLGSKNASSKQLKKKIMLEKRKNLNSHIDKKPHFDSEKFIIKGVINGGPFGRDGILSNNNDRKDSIKFGTDKTISTYFYFLLYLPPDSDQGCALIQSNSSEDSLTVLFREFVQKTFSGKLYYKAYVNSFCPESFQEEFKEGATIENLVFKKTILESYHAKNAIKDTFEQFDISISIRPKTGDKSISQMETFRNIFGKKLFGASSNQRKLDDFDEIKLHTKNEIANTSKVFEWNTVDQSFVPTVYLKKRIEKFNDDGTPDYDEVNDLCLNLLYDEIIPTLRPDLNAN